MIDEEIKMRCLELVYNNNDRAYFDKAQTLYEWVIEIREISNTRHKIKQNTVTYEKINPERNEK